MEQRLHDGRRLRRTVLGGRVVTEILPPAVRGAAPPELPELAMPEPLWRPPSCAAPAVSVIIRTIGTRPNWLRTAIASVLRQKAVTFELLVVVDGGDAGELPDDPRVGLLALPVNLGLAAARAAGIAHARGRWVRLLDDDDAIPQGSLAAQVAAAEAMPGAAGCAGLLQPWGGRADDWCQTTALRSAWDGRPETLGPLVRDHEWTLVPAGAVLWRREGLPGATPDYVTADDNAVLRLALIDRPLAWVDRPVVRYRRHDGGNSAGPRAALTELRVGMARAHGRHEQLARRTRRPRTVALLDHRLEVGGAQWALMQTMAQIDRRLIRPLMICSQASAGTEWCERHGITVRLVPSGSAQETATAAVLREERVDVLDVAWAARLITPALAELVPDTVAHAQSTDLRWAGLDNPVQPCAHIRRIIAVGEDVLTANPHLRSRATVIPSPVDSAAHRQAAVARAATRAIWDVAGDTPVVVWSGRLAAPLKRADLLEAMIRRFADRARFVVSGYVSDAMPGHADTRAYWQALAAECDVRWYSGLWPWQMPQVYAAADIYISTSDLEGLSLSMLEAMSAGCLPVVTDVGGVREAVPVSGGYIVPPGDEETLAAALGEALALPADARRAQAAAGRHAVAARFDVRAAARRHALFYWGEA